MATDGLWYDPAPFREKIVVTLQLTRGAMVDLDTDPLLSELARMALDNAFDAMVVTTSELDPPGPEILYVNPAWTRITGYSVAEARHQTPRLLQGPKTDRAVLDQLRRDLVAGRPANGEVINYRKNGDEFWLQWRIRPVVDPGGEVKYFVSTQRDITERKRIEQIKNEAIASVSHEMRSPLTAIYGALDLFQHEGPSRPLDVDAQLLENARLSCERLIRLVDAMLEAEKLSLISSDFDLEPTDLMPMIRQGIALHRLHGEELGVEIVFETEVEEAWVLADNDRLVQVLTNVLSNAIKFSPRGGVVQVGLERMANRLQISVSDRGAGIPEDFRPRVFKRFAQANKAPSKRHRGVGLGMAISKDIVEQLGGRIHFQTALGVGTTFYVELPEHSGVGRAGHRS